MTRAGDEAPLTIRRVRLVGFHNFVNETIEVQGGGHLFLLGDNGSGKTTVLDAIHLVLTGALDVELNAAVRFGGRREPGRSLAGVVLRHDAERGALHRSGATAYAALELASGDVTVTVGVGLEATSMDAQVTKWGFIRRGPLSALELALEVSGGVRAKTRDELRGALGKSDVFLKMTDYRRALAERLFGGEDAYEEICRFWGMAKSYREIVSGARDFAGLFERLLPGPDRAVLGEILDSLRRLDELEASIRALEEQRGYVAGVAELVRAIAVHREEIARHRWLALAWRKRELHDRSAAMSALLVPARREVEEAAAEVEAAAARQSDAERSVRTLEGADGTLMVARLREAEREHQGLERAAAAARAHAAACEKRHAEEIERHARSRESLFDQWRAVAGAAARAIEDASRLPTLLARAMETARGEERLAAARGSAVLHAIPDGARAEVAAALDVMRRASREAGLAEEERERALADARAELERLLVRPSPKLSGAHVAARIALERAGIEAAPLYELIEPSADANGDTLALIEALLGEATLGALVTDERDVARARAVLAEHRGSRLAAGVLGEASAVLPAWIDALFAQPRTERAKRARAVLAAALSQPASLGEPTSPNAVGAVELRGIAMMGTEEPAQLLGERARAQASSLRIAEARARVESAESSVRSATASARATTEALARLERAEEAFLGLRSASLFEAQRALSERARDVVHAAERLEESGAARAATEHRLAESARVLEAFRARAAGEDGGELEARLRAMRRALDERVTAVEAARERRVRAASELARLEQGEHEARTASEAVAAELTAADGERRRAAERVAPRSAEAVRDESVGDEPGGAPLLTGFDTLRAIERALDLATKNEHARCEELSGDGSRGTRRLAYAARFGLSFDRAELRVEDRRGLPVESVLAELDLAIGESREAFGQRTRDLLDTLVMGALARELEGQIERLYETVLDLNRLLAGLELGTARYRFRVVPRPERAELVTLVRRMSVLDPQSRADLRAYLDERRSELRGAGDGGDLLDYRRWFDYRLVVKRIDARGEIAPGDGETELTREVRALGSGGEQGVPNYLLVLALARLGYDAASARARPLLFDEAFYGIDAARRDALVRFATELGLQLVVASPDLDGVTPAVRFATTLFVVKDERGDVHLAPYHFANHAPGRQRVMEHAAPRELTP